MALRMITSPCQRRTIPMPFQPHLAREKPNIRKGKPGLKTDIPRIDSKMTPASRQHFTRLRI
jgi:hypothetical protein